MYVFLLLSQTSGTTSFSETDIVSQELGFKDKVNDTITTTDPDVNLDATGDVTVVKSNSTDVIQLTNGGSVTFPDDICLKDLNKCTSGFTLTLVVEAVNIRDDKLRRGGG